MSVDPVRRPRAARFAARLVSRSVVAESVVAKSVVARYVVAWCVAALALAGLAVGPARATPFGATGEGTFLALSDIHFDPFGDDALVRRLAAAPVERWPALFARAGRRPISKLGTDSNYTLMTSALDAAAKHKVDYVLVGGDLLSHDFEANAAAVLGSKRAARAFATKTTVFVAREIELRFPDVPVIPAIGNNDSDCGDYAIEPGGAYLARLARTWRLFAADPAAARAYARTGSFVTAHPTVPRHRIVVVNDVYLSREYVDVCRPDERDPGVATLDWLSARLDAIAAAGEKATLLFHIPPGYDGYASAASGPSCNAAVPLWKPRFAARFLDLAARHRHVVAGVFAGHLHSDGFRVLGADTSPHLPIHVVPSVSPVFGNNPAFTLFLYRRSDGRPLDSAVYFLQIANGRPVGDWRLEYTARAEYGLAGIGADALAKLSRRIADPDDPAAAAFRRNFAVRAHPRTNAATWRAYLCAQTAFTEAAFSACRCAP